MDPKEKALLDEVLMLSRQNNKILHSMQTKARIGALIKIVYWTIIIGAVVWGTYYLQPYIQLLKETYNIVSSQIQGLQKGIEGVTSTIQKIPQR